MLVKLNVQIFSLCFIEFSGFDCCRLCVYD